jgi:hypothetical protein
LDYRYFTEKEIKEYFLKNNLDINIQKGYIIGLSLIGDIIFMSENVKKDKVKKLNLLQFKKKLKDFKELIDNGLLNLLVLDKNQLFMSFKDFEDEECIFHEAYFSRINNPVYSLNYITAKSNSFSFWDNNILEQYIKENPL